MLAITGDIKKSGIVLKNKEGQRTGYTEQAGLHCIYEFSTA